MNTQDTQLLNLIGHAVFVIEAGSDGLPRYSACSAFALKAMGKEEKDVIGRTARELYPGRSGKIAYNHHVQGLLTGKERTYDLLLPLPHGQRRVLTRLIPDLDDHGNVVRLIGSSSDISGEHMVSGARANTGKINHEMEDFINLAAHDLRTPMRHVSLIAEMLREGFHDHGDGKVELINMLEDIGAKATSLISDVLAHAQTTRLKTEHVVFELSDMVDEIMGVLDPLKSCTFTVPNARIKGDRAATQMILRNLIDNAIKAENNGNRRDQRAPELLLTLDVTSSDGLVEIEVRDNGCGFGDTAIVFLNGGKLRNDSGFGMLGVRRLIHARGGTMMATNATDNSGAVVSFRLPGQLLDDMSDGIELTQLAM